MDKQRYEENLDALRTALERMQEHVGECEWKEGAHAPDELLVEVESLIEKFDRTMQEHLV
jgi:hypothetical protein